MTYCSEILTEFLSVANSVARGFGKRLNLKALICLLKRRGVIFSVGQVAQVRPRTARTFLRSSSHDAYAHRGRRCATERNHFAPHRKSHSKLRATGLTIWLLFGLWASLSAQEFQEIEFTVYGQYPIRDDIEYMPVSKEAIVAGAKAEKPVAIRTHSLVRIGPYSFKGGRSVSFYDTLTKELVGGVNLPSDSKKWLFIFVKNTRYEDDPKNQLKYKIYPFDDSLQNLPKNGLVFLNLSKMELSGTIGSRETNLAAGESEPFRISESLRIALKTPDFYGRKMLPAHTKNYQFKPNYRYLMILFPPVLKGSADADVRFLSESLEPPKDGR